MLTDTKIKKLKPKEKVYRESDGGGLAIEVKPTGKKVFILRYRHPLTKKQQILTIGQYPAISLSEARHQRDEAKALIEQGIDPNEHKKQRKLELQQEQAKASHKLDDMFTEYSEHMTKQLPNREPLWSNSTAHGNTGIYNREIKPFLGHYPIIDITTKDLETRYIEIEHAGKGATLKKVKSMINGLFDYAKLKGVIEDDITRMVSRSIGKGYKPKNMKHVVTPKEIRDLLLKMENMKASYEMRKCVTLSLHIFARPGETAGMKWEEVDFETGQIEKRHTKTRKPLIIPMSHQVRQILEDMLELTEGRKFVFDSSRSQSGHFNRDSLGAALRRTSIREVTPHGFRHTANSALRNLGFDNDDIDLQLNHMLQGVRGVYNKADRLPVRKKILQAWSDYLDGLKSGDNIIPLKAINE